MKYMDEQTPGGTNLTVSLLRAELRAARAEDKNDFLGQLDARLRPVNEHIASLDRGEFSPGLKAGIVAVVEDEKRGIWVLRSNRAQVIAACIVLCGILSNTALVLLH